jgi:hypothetical protein
VNEYGLNYGCAYGDAGSSVLAYYADPGVLPPRISTLQQARVDTAAMNDPAVMAEWAGYIERDVTAAGKSLRGATFVFRSTQHLKLTQARNQVTF